MKQTYDNPYIDSSTFKLNQILVDSNAGNEFTMIKKDFEEKLEKVINGRRHAKRSLMSYQKDGCAGPRPLFFLYDTDF